MEKYRCCNCGAVFNKEDAKFRQEYVGEFWGIPTYDSYMECPECDSDELEDFEIPYEECDTYKEYDYNCDSCDLKKRLEEEG